MKKIMKIISIKPGYVFEHKGVKLKAKQSSGNGCINCFFYEEDGTENCKKIPLLS